LTNVSESGFTSTTLNYDAAGRLKSVNYPGSVTDTRTYGSSGMMTARTVSTSGATIISDQLSYDLRGLLTSAYTGYRRGASSGLTSELAYTGLGALARSSDDLLSSGQSETFKPDAIGNRLRISRPGFKPSTDSDFLGVRFNSYDPEGRLTQVIDSVTAYPDNYELSQSFDYDLSGAQVSENTREWISGSGTTYDVMKSYPSIDDRLSVLNRHIGVANVSGESAGHHGVYQENWYDALGRRVLVRARKGSACNSTTFGDVVCKSYVERTV
jgi:YD repeat-containing protein